MLLWLKQNMSQLYACKMNGESQSVLFEADFLSRQKKKTLTKKKKKKHAQKMPKKKNLKNLPGSYYNKKREKSPNKG